MVISKEEYGNIEELQKNIGYKFKDIELLIVALTHSSYSNEAKLKGEVCECNERLEYLGDSVLQLAVSKYLYNNYSSMPEGEMSRVRSGAVCEKALAVYADAIDLGRFLFMGRGEDKNGGRKRASITSDAFEALLAAIFLDSGFESAEGLVLRFAVDEINSMIKSGHIEDYKSMLHEFIQQEHGENFEYVVSGESGPAHNKTFFVEARLNSNVIGKGKGHSKREAEQNAAYEVLKLFGVKV